MNRLLSTLTAVTAVAFMATAAFAAGKDPSEKGVPTSDLKIYTGGIGLGAMIAVNEELKDESGETFLQVMLTNSWQFKDNIALFGDFSWYISETVKNAGLDMGMDFLLSSSSARPFVGFGIGGHYFSREFSSESDDGSVDFGHKFGPSLTAHFGVVLDVTETVQVRFRAPYRAVLNKTVDQGFGLDLSVMFSSKFKKIQKLNY